VEHEGGSSPALFNETEAGTKLQWLCLDITQRAKINGLAFGCASEQGNRVANRQGILRSARGWIFRQIEIEVDAGLSGVYVPIAVPS
jgi:hypothetical protein